MRAYKSAPRHALVAVVVGLLTALRAAPSTSRSRLPRTIVRHDHHFALRACALRRGREIEARARPDSDGKVQAEPTRYFYYYNYFYYYYNYYYY